ncbi:MAG TPA: protein-disulfide reductase DsbD domain-containing protein [Chitinophagaceae bacterium]|nr:protein-disulfide reductase DsbD domain-containing protein [Chitinophagaceae bacterium]
MNVFKAILFLLFYFPLNSYNQLAHVKLAETPVINLKRGEQIIATIKFEIAREFHIMSDNPGIENFLPTTFKIEPVKEIEFGKIIFPASSTFKIKGTEEIFNVFDSTIIIKIPVSAGKKVVKGKYESKGNLFYQACDNRKCYFPKEFKFPVTIIVK